MSRYYKIQTATVGVAASHTSNMNIEGWDKIAIEIPTFSVYCNTALAKMIVYGYHADTTTTRTILCDAAGDGTSVTPWNVPSCLGNYMVAVPEAGYFKQIRIDLDGTNTTATAAMPIYIHGSMQS